MAEGVLGTGEGGEARVKSTNGRKPDSIDKHSERPEQDKWEPVEGKRLGGDPFHTGAREDATCASYQLRTSAHGRISMHLSCNNVMQRRLINVITKGAVREGFEPSVPFWGTAL